MTTDTLANGLKAVFGSAATPSSSSLIPFADSSRNPAGFTSLSDLALTMGIADLSVAKNARTVTSGSDVYFGEAGQVVFASAKSGTNLSAFALVFITSKSSKPYVVGRYEDGITFGTPANWGKIPVTSSGGGNITISFAYLF